MWLGKSGLELGDCAERLECCVHVACVAETSGVSAERLIMGRDSER